MGWGTSIIVYNVDHKNFINNLPGASKLSRIIKTESAGKDRSRLSREIVLAIRELLKKQQPDEQAFDMAAFITLSIKKIAAGIDLSVAAWEKKGYWLKADKFRMDWVWTERLGNQMSQSLAKEEWTEFIKLSIQVAAKLSDVKVTDNNRLGTPWIGAWRVFYSERH